MNVEPHWYIVNTVYIVYLFSNILLKKCKGFIKGKIIYTRQLKNFKVATLLRRKTKLPSFKNSRARLGENKEKLNFAINFRSILVCCQVCLKRGRFLANETTGFSSRVLTKLT